MKALIMCIFFMTSISATAWAIESSQKNVADELQADEAMSSLNSWDDVYNFYKKYKKFDDGYIAEGISDKVVKMLAKHWDKLKVLVKLAEKDEKFFEFVTSHVDATTDDKDLEMIINNSTNNCPDSVPSSICLKIEDKAKKALQEMDEFSNQSSIIKSVK